MLTQQQQQQRLLFTLSRMSYVQELEFSWPLSWWVQQSSHFAPVSQQWAFVVLSIIKTDDHKLPLGQVISNSLPDSRKQQLIIIFQNTNPHNMMMNPTGTPRSSNQRTDHSSFLDEQPAELLCHILSFCAEDCIAQLRLVSRRWLVLIDSSGWFTELTVVDSKIGSSAIERRCKHILRPGKVLFGSPQGSCQ